MPGRAAPGGFAHLRRRVEVVTPVSDPDARATLDALLTRELADPQAWALQADGSYARTESSSDT